MKKIFSAVVFILSMSTMAIAQTLSTDVSSNPNAPSFEWINNSFDFQNIPQGVPTTASFEFVNTGKEPLIITDVQKTCGCTNTEWPQEPIMPGQKGTIKAEYNAANEGPFNKSITVQSNSSTPIVKLSFKGTVVKDVSTGAPVQQTIFNSTN